MVIKFLKQKEACPLFH